MRRLGVLTAVAILGFATTARTQANADPEVVTSQEQGAAAAPADGQEAAGEQEDAKAGEAEQPEQSEALEQGASAATEATHEATGEADRPEEIDALESDIEAAAEKVLGAKGQNVEGFEEINAAPAGDSQPGVSGTVELTEESKGEDDEPFGLRVIMDHSFGTGNFVRESETRQKNDYIAQEWDIRPSYDFDIIGGHKLTIMARAVFEIELTQPDTNPSRRFKPSDVSLYVLDSEIYEEPLTEITFNLGARFFFPTSYESINVNRRWFAARLLAGATRSIGPVDLRYSFMTTKHFNSSKVTNAYSTIAREGDTNLAGGGAVRLARGFGTTSWNIINSFEVGYNVTESLAVSYSLLIWNTFSYNLTKELEGQGIPCEQYKAEDADCGGGRTDVLWPTLEVSYELDDLIETVVALPFSLTVAGGITALHPAQSPDNDGILWPWFYPAFADNRAARNYGSVYVDLVGVY